MSDVVYMMWLRQVKKYFRSKSRLVASLGQPILFLVAFGFGFAPIYAKAGGGDYIQFLAPGIIAMSTLFTAMFGGIDLIWDRQFGFLKETLVAPVKRSTIMFGKTLGGATVATLQGILVFIITLLVGFNPVNWFLVPLAFLALFLIALIFTAFGTAIAARMTDMQAFPIIMNFLIMPIFFLSGALFPLEGVPDFITVLSNINPLSYGVDAVRGALAGVFHFGYVLDFGMMFLWTMIMMAAATYLFSRIRL
jgi:ABC-2 type transport system permease protein